MLSVAEALEQVLGSALALPARGVPLAEAAGHVLAAAIVADHDSPPFDKALVDGYAVRATDLARGVEFRVVDEIYAGQTPRRVLGPDEAALVMTGAPLPSGADLVVMVERSHRTADRVILEDEGMPMPGRNRMPRGREMKAGEQVLESGQVITPAVVGLLATLNQAEPVVVPRPRVAIVSTGDELVEVGQPLGPGQIRNSNAPMLSALVTQWGAVARVLPTARDEATHLRSTLEEGLTADVLLISGGVSAGKKDLVPDTLRSLGVEPVFHKIRLKPGKPLFFGVKRRAETQHAPRLVFGLPGNPVSSLVGALLFVKPALAKLAGRAPSLEGERLPLAISFEHRGDRPTYHPARIERREGRREILPLPWAGSPDLRTVALARGFAVFPAGDRSYEPGEIVEFRPLG